MRKDNLCTCAGGSWYGLHQYEATEPKKIMWEHAGNKGTFGNAAYVTLTLMEVRKSCCIREKIIGIVMASERDFDNVTCVWSFNLYAL